MLLFYCADRSDLPRIREAGLRAPDGAGIVVNRRLADAASTCGDRLLVFEADVPDDDADCVEASIGDIAPAAFYNLDPYLPPVAVPAGGGYVVRGGKTEPELLLIFRRGAWDLPKGKQDEGEDVETCALREVREEIGVDELWVDRALGTTTHVYPEDASLFVKTTHWFQMGTTEERFSPERSEGIEEVTWVPWSEARRRVDYETLRRHMQRVEPLVLSSFR